MGASYDPKQLQVTIMTKRAKIQQRAELSDKSVPLSSKLLARLNPSKSLGFNASDARSLQSAHQNNT